MSNYKNDCDKFLQSQEQRQILAGRDRLQHQVEKMYGENNVREVIRAQKALDDLTGKKRSRWEILEDLKKIDPK